MGLGSDLGRKMAACFICIIMVVSSYSVPAVNAAEKDLDAKIAVSYDFQEDFDMIFNCKIYTSGNFSNVRLSVDFGGKKTEIKQADFADPSTGLYRFTFRGVSAAEMTTVAKAKLCANIGTTAYESQVKETTVRSYAMDLLDYYSKLTDTKVETQRKAICTAIVDMLNYGAAAQVYFGKNTNDLANKNLTSAQKNMGSSLSFTPSTCLKKTVLSGAKASVEKIALSFENPVDLILYAKFDEDPSNSVKAQVSYKEDSGSTKTLTVASSAFEKNEEYGLYRIEFKDIPSRYLRSELTIVLKNGNTSISSTVKYSGESYVKAILDGNFDNNVKDLVKKMLVYGDSAKAYAATLPKGCVTYRQFGAMGTYYSSKTNITEDYYALLMAHDYANAKNLPVKADVAAHYYVKYMNPRSYKGALIKTETDWGNANFTIDDETLGKDSIEMSNRIIQFSKGALTEGHCFLFTVEPSKPFEYKYINPSSGIYLGVDANLSSYPEYPSTDNSIARTFKNKTFSKDTTLFEGNFTDKALYVLKTQSAKRYGRNHASGDAGRDQQEVIVINDTIEKNGKKYGVLDSSTKLQWDWKEIYIIHKFPIDEKTLTVKGGTFTTIANTDNGGYIYRGISIVRSNVVLENVKHKLIGEEKRFASDCEHSKVTKASKGRPYMGFYHLDHCAYVTLRNCTFSDHYSVNDGTYDYYAEYAAVLKIENCKCEPIVFKNSVCTYEDKSGIMDPVKWGTTGTNYIKDIRVIDSSISRIDAHKGTYGLYVSGSTLGSKGVAAVGYGDMKIIDSTVRSANFITLRQDFGSYWNGDIYVKGCTWDLGEKNYTKGFIRILYDPTFNVGYDPIIDENGKKYYSTLPKNIYIDGLTIDARNVDLNGGYALYNRGFNVFDQVIRETAVVDEDYLNLKDAPSYEEYAAEVYNNDPDPAVRAQRKAAAIKKWHFPYYFPIKNTENVYVKNLHVIRRKGDDRHTQPIKIYLRNPNPLVTKDAYFFTKESDKANKNPDPNNPYWDDSTTTYSDEYPTT